MKTIIHDLNTKELKKVDIKKDDYIINAKECKNTCVGCFSCWIKHPKKCIYNDNYSNMVNKIKDSDELVIISESKYGCYSSCVKRVLERCIGYVLPYFTTRNNEMHHKTRYDNQIKLKGIFYGDINSQEKKNLYKLIKANAINLNASPYEVYFINLKEVKNVHIH